MCVCACEYVCNLYECVCLIEGLADKLKSLLQMLNIPSVCDSVSFQPGQVGGKKHEQRWKDVGMKGYMYAHPHSFHPLFFPVLLFLVTAAYSFFPPPLFFLHMYALCVCVYAYLHVCVPASLMCQSIREGRGALILVLMG